MNKNKDKRLARRIKRVAAGLGQDSINIIERIERILSKGDKSAILAEMDGAEKAELITKINSAVSFINSNKKQGTPNKSNPLV